jgi:hypothetical protein
MNSRGDLNKEFNAWDAASEEAMKKIEAEPPSINTMVQPLEEIKPCPFCGGEARIYHHEGENVVDCECDRYGKTDEEAIAAWNRRTLPEVTEGEIENILKKFCSGMVCRGHKEEAQSILAMLREKGGCK